MNDWKEMLVAALFVLGVLALLMFQGPSCCRAHEDWQQRKDERKANADVSVQVPVRARD